MKRHHRKIIYLAGFLFSIPLALTSYINSSFLETFLNARYVGVVYMIAATITIIAMLGMHKILTRFGNRRTTLALSLVMSFSFVLLGSSQSASLAILGFILYFLTTNFIIASLDIFMEDFSENASIGEFRGFYLMVVNSAWIFAQIISGSIINKSSYSGIYMLASGFSVMVCIIFAMSLRDFKDPHYKKIPILKNLKFFAHNKNVSKIYLINLILKFFFAWMIIYTPIYLHEYMGFGWDKIGIIFTIMLLPFLLFDYPLGKLSDKIGEKKILTFGFFISAISTLMIPLIDAPIIFLWGIILFATRVGAACIEVMSESYFFKSIKEEDAEATSFFRNTTPISFILAPLVATPLLLLFPSFEYLFFILTAVLLVGLFLSLRLKDVR